MGNIKIYSMWFEDASSNTKKYAEKELKILFDSKEESIIKNFESEIIALCDKFGKSGQSGGSAPYTARALAKTIENLCLQQTIAPLTGKKEEWCLISKSLSNKEMVYQNNRNSAIFKNEEGKAYYLDAIIKRDQKGNTWTGSFWLNEDDYKTGDINLKIKRVFIKSFPFIPKTFYIDVIDKEVAPDDWESFLKDPRQLEEVYEYYNKE